MSPDHVSGWAMQQLAGLLAGIAAYDDEPTMLARAAHRIAEAVDAEVCVLVSPDGEAPVAIGFPAHDVPIETLVELVASGAGKLEVAGLGTLQAQVVAVGTPPDGHFVIARTSSPLSPDENHLVRSMAQVIDQARQLQRSADRERALRLRSEEQAAALAQANAELLEASESKDVFIAVASHELRTPLTSILGFAGTLRSHADRLSEEQRNGYLEIIERQGKRLLRLIDDLLTVGRLDSGQLTPSRTPTDVVEAISNTVATHPTPPAVAGRAGLVALVDRDHLDQIVLNLVTNAEKYGRPPLRIEVGPQDECIEVAVEDAGDGVPADFVPRLFERFTQASIGEAREGSGAGLGLAIVAGLATANGGAVRYERTTDRTRFVVRLPAAGVSSRK